MSPVVYNGLVLCPAPSLTIPQTIGCLSFCVMLCLSKWREGVLNCLTYFHGLTIADAIKSSHNRTISSPSPPSLPITRDHLHLPPLSVTPSAFHSKLKSHLFNLSYPDRPFWSFPLPISTTPTLTATLSPPGTLEIGPELLLTPLWKPPLIRRSARE